jgi:hypothetical protein
MDRTYEFTSFCDDYDFTVGKGVDDEGDEFYYGVDIPCEIDTEWHFWLLYDHDCIEWKLSNKEKENIIEQAAKYCLGKGYTFNGKYFER